MATGERRIAVVGGGLAGLSAVMKACEAGAHVDLFSVVPVKRSHSVCAQGGINGAVNTKGEGDSTWEHFDDTVYGGDFLANQKPVKGMCEAAPGIIYLFDRMGVPFNRTPEGLLDFRRFGGTKHHRTAFAGASTGQQLLYALDEQVRRFEAKGQVRKFEFWEFVRLVQDGQGQTCGIIALDLHTMEPRAFPADAVIFATGGPGLIFGRSTNSMINTGSAAAVLYAQGAKYANGEFIQVHPTAIPGDDKLRLMSESARGEGGRVWTWGDENKTWTDSAGQKHSCGTKGKPWYFLEEMYPSYGNLVPRDVATRAIFKVVTDIGMGVDGKAQVYLDLSHKDPHELERKLGSILEIYQRFTGEDPKKVPMKIFPAVHYSMGGIWADDSCQTSLKGAFAVGECNYMHHGANRLGANSLLSCIYDGFVGGPAALKAAKGRSQSAADLDPSVFNKALKEVDAQFAQLRDARGSENPYSVHRDMGDLMTEACTVVRENGRLTKALETLQSLDARYARLGLSDNATWTNQSLVFAFQLKGMLRLARVIAKGALLRNESRGAHYKPEFPKRNDKDFLKTTIATFDAAAEDVTISYEPVDVSLIPPRERNYEVDKKAH
ncbi:MAG: succinate dehydrogenase flavoprotein subunit [Planctomycetota bacterium]